MVMNYFIKEQQLNLEILLESGLKFYVFLRMKSMRTTYYVMKHSEREHHTSGYFA